jgi:hypothetical protein
MVARAYFLRKATDTFISEDNELQALQLSKIERDQAAIFITILLPFKIVSQSLRITKRPGIDSVYWNYEALFNKIDAIKETFTQSTYTDTSWIQENHIGVDQLSPKLQKYYMDTDMPFVYPDCCILESRFSSNNKDLVAGQRGSMSRNIEVNVVSDIFKTMNLLN